MYKLLFSETINYSLTDNAQPVHLNKIFNTDYQCYQIFFTATGNQNTYKVLRYLDENDAEIAGTEMSMNSNFFTSPSSVLESDAASSSSGGFFAYQPGLRNHLLMGKAVMTIWHPADTTMKTRSYLENMTDHFSSTPYDTFNVTTTCNNDQTTDVRGLSFRAYGIGEDIESVDIQVYGVEL
jgi:hypothetical protein